MASSASAAAASTASSSSKRSAPLTALAKKYGHPYKKIKGMSHRILKSTGKSGITPLSPFFPANMIPRNPTGQRQKYQFYFYQQHRYQGFTAAELHNMESLSAFDTTATSSPLLNPIHPMFGKAKWDQVGTSSRHLPLIPLFTGHDGFWQVCFQYLQAAVADGWYLSRSAIQLYGASSILHSGLPPIFCPTLRCGRGKFHSLTTIKPTILTPEK